MHPPDSDDPWVTQAYGRTQRTPDSIVDLHARLIRDRPGGEEGAKPRPTRDKSASFARM